MGRSLTRGIMAISAAALAWSFFCASVRADGDDLSVLPPTSTQAAEETPHFPSRMAAFVWRNWNIAALDRMADAVNAKLKSLGKEGKISLAEETADITGGMILKDEKVEVNCAYETLLRLNKKEIAGQVAKLLFA